MMQRWLRDAAVVEAMQRWLSDAAVVERCGCGCSERALGRCSVRRLACVLPLVAAGGERVQRPRRRNLRPPVSRRLCCRARVLGGAGGPHGVADRAGAGRCGPWRRRYQCASLSGDDVLHACPCPGAEGARSPGRARRCRCAGRARASRLRHRPAVAPQPAALPHVAQRRRAGGAGRPRRPRRQRHRAVSPALGHRAALFHRRRAAHGRPRRGHDAARGGGGGGARARLPRHPPRGPRHQPRRDRALPQERLPRVRPPAPLLRGRRRCAAVREAARRRAPHGGRRLTSTRPPSSPAARPA